MSFMENLQAKIAEAAEHTDMNEAQKGGGDRPIPAAGMVRLRFVSYVELGIHEDEWKGVKKNKNRVVLQFELSGPKHEPRDFDGRKIADVITINENISLNEKANFYKLFKRMNHTGQFKHMAQMLGQEFLGTIVHVTKGEGDQKRIFANLRDDGGYTIRPPYVEDPETGESKRITVQPALTATKCFLWDYADKEQWDSIFIDGRWDDKTDDAGKVIEEGRSKNYYQNTIKAATNFSGSPLAEVLFAGVDQLELGEGEKPERSEADKEATSDAKAGVPADPLEAVG